MVVIQIEDLWKEYRLGVIGHGTLTHDLQSWWARLRGKEDPNSKIKHKRDGREKQIERDRFWAIREVNFNVEQGEVLGIIGRNGAGKSTLLKILSRVTAPTKGSISVKGRIASLLEVGTGFHPELTGRENIFMNGAILGMSKREIRTKLDEIIDFSGVEKFIDTPVKRYSSGMYVRLAFAVAAHLEPEILVVDEVLAVGDVEFQKKCLGKMGEVARAGRTVLFVSHNLEMIEKLCPQSLLLGCGEIIVKGNTSSVLNRYVQESVTQTPGTLVDKHDRQGAGEIKFSKVEYLNENRECVSGAKVGYPLIIRVFFENTTKSTKYDARFSVAVNSLHKELMNLDTSVADGRNLTLMKDGYVDFIIPRLPLTKGIYYLGLFVEANREIQDWIVHGPQLNVAGGAFFVSGKNCVKGFEMKQVIVEHSIDYSW